MEEEQGKKRGRGKNRTPLFLYSFSRFLYFTITQPTLEENMAQEAYDKLMEMTDSRYRLSMIAARRAAQLKAGVPPVLAPNELPKTKNAVTIALKELAIGKGILWGTDESLPTNEELKQSVEREMRANREQSYTVTRLDTPDDDEDLGDEE
jgi:DNA-directed RNA polymerase subunit omega